MTSLADKVARVKELDAKRTQGKWQSEEGLRGANMPPQNDGVTKKVAFYTIEDFVCSTPKVSGDEDRWVQIHNQRFIAHAPQMAALITQLWEENQKQREVLGLARVSLNKAKRAINGREHTGFIDTALTAIDNVMKGE